MKNYMLALAAVLLVTLPGCGGGSSCCKKGDTACKQEEVCAQPAAAEQVPAQEETRVSGPLSDKEVGFTEADGK